MINKLPKPFYTAIFSLLFTFVFGLHEIQGKEEQTSKIENNSSITEQSSREVIHSIRIIGRDLSKIEDISGKAEAGDPEAQFQLSRTLLLAGNRNEAKKWAKKALENGNLKAHNMLGSIYKDEGEYNEAINHFKIAAELGDKKGQFNLAQAYQTGIAVNQDLTKAIFWYTKAAENNFDMAQLFLGNIYADGIGTEKDLVKAKEWLTKAASQGNEDAKARLAEIIRSETPTESIPQNSDKDISIIIDYVRKGNQDIKKYEGQIFTYDGYPTKWDIERIELVKQPNNIFYDGIKRYAKNSAVILKVFDEGIWVAYPKGNYKNATALIVRTKNLEEYIELSTFLKNGKYRFTGVRVYKGEKILLFDEVETSAASLAKPKAKVDRSKSYPSLSLALINFVCMPPQMAAIPEGEIFDANETHIYGEAISMFFIVQKVSATEYMFSINPHMANLRADEPKNIFYLKTYREYGRIGEGLKGGFYQCTGTLSYKDTMGFNRTVPAFEEVQ